MFSFIKRNLFFYNCKLFTFCNCNRKDINRLKLDEYISRICIEKKSITNENLITLSNLKDYVYILLKH